MLPTAPDGYKLDPTPQTIQITAGKTHTLTFKNTPKGGLQLIKVDSSDHSQRIANVTFEIHKLDGALVGTFTTGTTGTFYAPLEAGSYYAVEVSCPKDYKLDDTPHYFTVQDGKTTTLTIENTPFSGILIHKIDADTKEGIYGVSFLLYDSKRNPIGEYQSDQRGYVYIEGLEPGRYYLRELENEGYIVDDQLKTIYVRAGETMEITWKNKAVTGQIQVIKYAADYNPITGAPAGSTLSGAVFEIVRARSGVVVGYITTDARGVAASDPLPLGRYLVREVTAPAYYQLSDQTFDVDLEYEGQIIKLAAYNKSANTSITITKTGNSQVLAGSTMRYQIKVANTSNVPLNNFYWHDRVPTDAVTASSLVTGTYSTRLTYRILYKTNYNDYRVLASNLLTTNNYSFRLNALPMMSGEVITDLYFDFGTVPSGFQSVSHPLLMVAVKPQITNGYQIINRADAGGRYQSTWETRNTSWLTIVRNLTPSKPKPLPPTGY